MLAAVTGVEAALTKSKQHRVFIVYDLIFLRSAKDELKEVNSPTKKNAAERKREAAEACVGIQLSALKSAHKEKRAYINSPMLLL